MTSLQVNILLLCLGAIQGIFLFLLLFKKRHSLPGYGFLAGYLAVMLLQIAMKIASKLWLMQNAGPLYSFSYYLPFLYGPLIYLFVRKVTSRQIDKKDVLHFLPVILIISLFVFGDPRSKVPVFLVPLFHTLWSMVLQLVSLTVYHLPAFYSLNKQGGSSINHLMQYRVKWLRQFVVISFVVCSAIAVVICLMYYHFPHWQNIRFVFTTLTVFIYWISYKAWSQPELFSFVRGYSNEPIGRSVAPALTVHLPLKKYSNSGLVENDIDRIITALENKMRSDKLYLDEGLTIDLLAENLGCSKHHLSQVLNERLNKSFYDYINHLRVDEAKHLLSDPAKINHKIASIAYDSGFNSISTFNDVFKKISGITPSQFRKQREEKNLQKQRV